MHEYYLNLLSVESNWSRCSLHIRLFFSYNTSIPFQPPMKKFVFLNKFTVGSFLAGVLFTVMATNVGAALKGSAIFRDVSSGHYADQAIGDAYANGILTGYDSTHFGPDDPVTRGQLALVLSRLQLIHATATPTTRSSASRSSASRAEASSSSSSIPYTAAGQLRFDSAAYTQDENASIKSVTVGIVRTGGNQGTVSVNYAFTGGTAVIGKDYIPLSGTLTFENKETSKKITLEIKDDSVSDGNRTVEMRLSNPTNGAVLGNPSLSILTIVDNEAQGSGSSSSASTTSTSVMFSALAYSAMENAGTITIAVQRTGVTTGVTDVDFATSNGSAQSGADYAATSGKLTFAAGETSKTFTVSLVDNAAIEGNRTVNLGLTNPTNGASVGAPAPAILTIIDNESASSASGSLKFSTASYSVLESQGNASITVMHVGGVGPVTVNYSAAGGTALAGSDYTSVTGTLNFAQGETSKIFLVPITKDSAAEGEETVNLTLNTPSGGVTFMDPSAATLKIND